MDRSALLIAAALLAAGCTPEPAQPGSIAGTGQAVASSAEVPAVVAALQAALDGKAPIATIATLDHAGNAARVGKALAPAQVVFFGSPALGTPLMQRSPLAGLDLPQHILIYEDGGATRALYNTPGYLAARHGLAGVETLSAIDEALAGLVTAATGAAPEAAAPASVSAGAGIETRQSDGDVEATYARLKAAIDSKPPLSIVFTLDHAANAASAGLALPPMRVVAFGNPALGTPLMESAPSLGLDLPQKMLIWQAADGGTHIAWNDPAWLAARHGVTGRDAELAKIAAALHGLAEAAAGEE